MMFSSDSTDRAITLTFSRWSWESSVSLSSSALIHLGVAPDPVSGETVREPAYAKQTIDILGMIQEKTKGNLSKEESQLLEGMLYDLRMRYISEMEKENK